MPMTCGNAAYKGPVYCAAQHHCMIHSQLFQPSSRGIILVFVIPLSL